MKIRVLIIYNMINITLMIDVGVEMDERVERRCGGGGGATY